MGQNHCHIDFDFYSIDECKVSYKTFYQNTSVLIHRLCVYMLENDFEGSRFIELMLMLIIMSEF